MNSGQFRAEQNDAAARQPTSAIESHSEGRTSRSRALVGPSNVAGPSRRLGQDRRDPGGEFIERERLSQNFHAVRQVGVVERSPGVAGYEENPQAWRRRTGGVRELPPAQARKPDVGDQKIQMAR
jgi:hypothetical protein